MDVSVSKPSVTMMSGSAPPEDHAARSCSSSATSAMQRPPTPPETSELIVLGLPGDFDMEPINIASLILRALKLPHLETDVLTSEAFPCQRVSRLPQDSIPTPANSSDPVLQSGRPTVRSQADSRGQFRRIVIQFKSAYMRDSVITTRLGFKTSTANLVFGHPSNSSRLLRTVYPKPVFLLLTLACSKSTKLGYRSPRVVDMLVHHVVAITKSKLSAADGATSVAVDGYDLVRHDRVGRRGGGTSKIRDGTSPEYVVLEISSDRDKLLFAVVYRPKVALPHTFFGTLSKFLRLYNSVVITGDFNCDMLSATSFESRYLNDLIKSHALYLVPSPATYHAVNGDRVQSDTWLDLFIVHSLSAVTSSVKSDTPFTYGHDRIELTLSFARDQIPNHNILNRSLSRLADNVSFLDDVKKGLSTFNDTTKLSDMLSSFNMALATAHDRFASLRQITINTRRKPWVTPAFRAAIKESDQIYQRVRDRNSSELMAEYRTRRAMVLRHLRAAKSDHYAGEIEAARQKNGLWSALRRLGVVSSRMTSPFFRALTINTGTFPSLWKRTLITPIPKVSLLSDVSDL
ncbi:hypothetical protein TSAR_015098 [Trichomalopsis sarcophagae]|uniref:Endonuclease/exonuclease/phosphatase domain-containing protein n=1 Tax=Trichomalopsis sarcophagae TaxID=543379 RepID=A0A232EJ86_9HYME|nr:hypothetical protein TSAR_015098 [Trichomalopsis sarcophagae]